ncbi:hypothetical protein [Qipengyuania sp.]|uniref:hypothetical protein n=1 Tax=Qipengyuania sp. TaxID=2004515 RepID=UPI0035C86CC8
MISVAIGGLQWLETVDADCGFGGHLRVRVGSVVYDLPPWTDPQWYAMSTEPGLLRSGRTQRERGFGRFCQHSGTPVIKVALFGFRLPEGGEEIDPMATANIGDPVQVARTAPSTSPLRADMISSVTFSPIRVDPIGSSARVDLTLHLSGGQTYVVPATCQRVAGIGGTIRRWISRCSMRLRLVDGNVLLVTATPNRGNNLRSLGSSLVHALRTAEQVTANP